MLPESKWPRKVYKAPPWSAAAGRRFGLDPA
jgi:hypothetical protein